MNRPHTAHPIQLSPSLTGEWTSFVIFFLPLSLTDELVCSSFLLPLTWGRGYDRRQDGAGAGPTARQGRGKCLPPGWGAGAAAEQAQGLRRWDRVGAAPASSGLGRTRAAPGKGPRRRGWGSSCRHRGWGHRSRGCGRNLGSNLGPCTEVGAGGRRGAVELTRAAVRTHDG